MLANRVLSTVVGTRTIAVSSVWGLHTALRRVVYAKKRPHGDYRMTSKACKTTLKFRWRTRARNQGWGMPAVRHPRHRR